MKITVLLHERDTRADAVPYTLWPMCDLWRRQGHEVELVYGVGQPIRGDVVIPHIDLSVVPDEYVRALAEHPCVVNRAVADITKTSYSRNQVHSPDEYDGPVIVKTVLNHGGRPEKRMGYRKPFSRLKRLLAKRGLLPLSFADVLSPHEYPIFQSARDVPRGVFSNPALFVERFLPERFGDLYRTRSYLFMGDCWTNEWYASPRPVVKRAGSVMCEEVPVPEEIVAIRKALGCDYGKLDYVLHEGRVVLLDLSRTPAVSGSPDRQHRRGETLAPGIESFVR